MRSPGLPRTVPVADGAPRRWTLAALCLCVGLLPSVGAPGLEPKRPAAAPPLVLELSKGELVRLSAPALSVFVANPEIADIQVTAPTLVYVFAKQAGETTLFAVDGADKVLVNRKVVVRHNLSALARTFSETLPRARIEANSIEGGILLTGVAGSPEEAEAAGRLAARFVPSPNDVINRIAVTGPTQIHLRVRVAEVSRSVSKRFGINWESLGRSGNFQFGFARGRDIVGADGNLSRAQGLDSLFAGLSTGSVNLNVLIDALAAEGLVTILAEPSLTALSGQEASFLAGGEFPIPVSGENNRVTVAFREFGVRLNFLPRLAGETRINLKVRPEVSQLSAAGAVRAAAFDIPALTTRRAETTVELASGQSFAVAGLLQSNANQSVDKFPLLGDVPVLGALFRSQSFQRNETELVIIVTPYLVQPVDAGRIAAPTDPAASGTEGPAAPRRLLASPDPVRPPEVANLGPGYVLP